MNHLVGTLLGQYQLTEMIGHGGMAIVYKAYQRTLDREVAVKVLRAPDPTFVARFKREALASARLQHPYILPVYDFGEQDGLLYLVLQYVEGGTTLADLLNGPMEPVAALRLIGHVLDALGYAHKSGIIHRDIKPANILMRSPVWPLLADFGIAKLVNETSPLTQGGLLLGTVTYMAPEQAVGRPAGVSTDLYAVGVVLYELLTGRVPFYDPEPVALLHKHAYEPLPPPRSLNPRIPVGVEQFLMRALAKNPDVRYQSAADMAAELGRLVYQLERFLSSDQLRTLYESGVQAFEAEHWGGAIEQLDQVVAREPAFEDSAELLELARAAQSQARAGVRLFNRSAVTGAAHKLFQQGQRKERSGDLTGALADYQAARAMVYGRGREEVAARMAVLMACIRREQQRLTPAGGYCARCGRHLHVGQASCSFCFGAGQPAARQPGEHHLADPPFAGLQSATTQEARIAPAKPDRVASPFAPQRLPPAPVAAANASPARTPVLADDIARPARARRHLPLVALMLGLALLGGGGGIIWANQQRAPAAGQIIVVDRTSTPTTSQIILADRTAPSTLTASPTASATPSPSPTATDTPSPTAINTPTPVTPQAIANGRLNLRAGPSQAYDVLSTYDTGTVFKLLGRNSAQTWLQLEAPDGRVGWMTAQFLRVNVNLVDISVIVAPPLPTARPTARSTARPTARPTATPEQAPQPLPTSAPVLPADTAPPAPTQPPEPPPLPEPTEAPQPTSPPRREPTPPPRREPTSPPR